MTMLLISIALGVVIARVGMYVGFTIVSDPKPTDPHQNHENSLDKLDQQRDWNWTGNGHDF